MATNKQTEPKRIYYPLADAAVALGMSADALLHCASLAQIELLTPVPNDFVLHQDAFILSASAMFVSPLDDHNNNVHIVDDLSVDFLGGGLFFYGLDGRVCFEIEALGVSRRARFDRCYRVDINGFTLEAAHLNSTHSRNKENVKAIRDGRGIMTYFLEGVNQDGAIGFDITRDKLFVSDAEIKRFKADELMDSDKQHALSEPVQATEAWGVKAWQYAVSILQENPSTKQTVLVSMTLEHVVGRGWVGRGGNTPTAASVERAISGVKKHLGIEPLNKKKR